MQRPCFFIATIISFVLMLMMHIKESRVIASTTVVGSLRQYGKITQHRVRATKRHLQYSSTHPWIDTNDHNKKRLDQEIGISRKKSPGTSKATAGSNFSETILLGDNSTHDSDLSKSNATFAEEYKDEAMSIWVDSDVEVDQNSLMTYQPIRIRAGFVLDPSSGYHYLSTEQRDYIMKMIKPTLNNWSQALSVPRIVGNLTIDLSQLYDGLSCGPGIGSGMPSVVVPDDHLTKGVPGIDLMVYLSVGFHDDFSPYYYSTEDETSTMSPSSSLTQPSNDNDYGWVDFVNYTGPSPFFQSQDEKNTTNTNFIAPNVTMTNSTLSHTTIYNSTLTNATIPPSTISPSSVQPPRCSGSYLASATYCSTDQFDRPIAGMLHLCIGSDFFEQDSLKMNQLTVMHELGHILGFNPQSLAYFRDRKTGLPLTERIDDDVPDVEIECTGVKYGRGNATIPLPSEKILQFKDVRGIRVAQVVTPTVKHIVRNRFDCQELEGAELESSAFHPMNETDQNCLGEHWERRLFKNDIMNPILDPTIPSSLLSPLTLAYFIDSGWYEVNSTRAYSADTWGRGAGCQFVNKLCLDGNGRVSNDNSNFFCAEHHTDQFDGCTHDLSSKGTCSVTAYNVPLPSEYQYFPHQNVGGIDSYLDYCPVFVEATQGYCKSRHHNMKLKHRLDDYGHLDSRCLSGSSDGHIVPLCVQVACSVDSRSLHVKVDGYWKKCEYMGQILTSWWNEDYGTCGAVINSQSFLYFSTCF